MSPTYSIQRLLIVTALAVGVCYFIYRDVILAPQLHRNDFKHLYIGAYLAGHPASLYDPAEAFRVKEGLRIPGGLNPYVYPPFMAVFVKSLALFDYDTAWWIWCWFNNLLLLLTLGLLCHVVPEKDMLAKWATGILLFSLYEPIFRTVSAGQFNIVLLFAFTLAFLLLQKNRYFAAGAVIGVVAAAKVAPAIFVIPFLLFERRALAGLIVSAVACTAVAVVVTGWDQHLAYLEVLQAMSYGESTWEQFGVTFHVEPANQAPSAIFYRLVSENPKTTPLLNTPQLAYGLSIGTALLVLAAALWASYRSSGICSVFVLWIYPMLLIPSLCWDHYFTQLLLPIWWLIWTWKNGSDRRAWLFAMAVALICVPYHFESEWWKSGIGILGASMKGFAAVVLYLITIQHTVSKRTFALRTATVSSFSENESAGNAL